MKQKVVIIGAGPAGLTTAYQLLKDTSNNYDITIIEAENTVGGISKTISLNDEYLVDTGIHRFFSKNKKVNEIWNEILPIQSKPAYDDIILENHKQFDSEGSDPEKDKLSMLKRNRLTRIYYNKNFFDYPVKLNLNTLKNLGFIKIIKIAITYIKACIKKKEETSLENFYINRFGSELYETFFKDYTEKVWGVEATDISPDWGSQRVKGVSISEIFKDIFYKIIHIKPSKEKEVSLIEEFLYPKLGAGQMWECMADKIKQMGGKIIFNSKVIKIEKRNNVISNITYSNKNQECNLDLDILISSMPIKDLFMAIDKDNIDDKIYMSAINLPYRNFIVVYLLVDKLNLINKTKIKTIGNIIPDDWLYIQDNSVKLGRIQIFNNWSPYLFKNKSDLFDKVLMSLEYFASENDELWNKNEQEMIDFAKEEAIKLNLINEDSVILAKSVKIPKAYPSYIGTYDQMDKIREDLDKIENLYCIGRNGQHRYNNMDHSMLTGIETANNIMKDIKTKDNIWNVNTEKEYHEIAKVEQ